MKSVVSKTKFSYDELYERLGTKGSEKYMHRLAKIRDNDGLTSLVSEEEVNPTVRAMEKNIKW